MEGGVVKGGRRERWERNARAKSCELFFFCVCLLSVLFIYFWSAVFFLLRSFLLWQSFVCEKKAQQEEHWGKEVKYR